jgi:hypothetical protein
MATKLDKDLVRESTDMIDGKSILATLTADQCIELKLKGVRGAGLKISLLELHKYLTNPSVPVIKEEASEGAIVVPAKKDKKFSSKMINLDDLRSENLIGILDLPTKMKFEKLIVDLLKRDK